MPLAEPRAGRGVIQDTLGLYTMRADGTDLQRLPGAAGQLRLLPGVTFAAAADGHQLAVGSREL